MAVYPAIWLHVRAHNSAAIAMYLRLGLCQLHRLERFYSNGEAAIVMATPDLVPDTRMDSTVNPVRSSLV
jgi:ribosomal protein S18 acetylase RimI-like enzyme